MKYCTECGKKLGYLTQYCGHCGKSVEEMEFDI